MASVTRQPFAPLDGARLQTLTSLKNRQNALPSAPVKRKASEVADSDDFENVDPVLFSKRSKGTDSFFSSKDFVKPSTFMITKSASTSNVISPVKAATPRPRTVLQAKSPMAKLNTGIAKSSPLSAPAGRSPTRGKRSGILSSRRRTAGPYTRVDPPVFSIGASGGSAAAPFSLDAALKGTISSYTSRKSSPAVSSSLPKVNGLHEPEMKSDWFFDIHEDTPEQEMTNLLQHSTCVLDISSDEESETKRQQERAEGKENVPPMDDVSQTTRPRAARAAPAADEMIVEKERSPLGEMDVKQYFAEGCDESTVVIVPGDEEEEVEGQAAESANTFEFAPELKPLEPAVPEAEPLVKDGANSVDELMQKTDEPAPGAALLEPIEGTGENFEVWESGSAKDETEPMTAC